MRLLDKKSFHFIGAGGAGMSGLAQILLEQGKKVTGSDSSESETVRRLRAMGAGISIGHKASNIAGAEAVIYSSMIRKENAEMVEADLKGIPLISRGKMLSFVFNEKDGIAICGSHGKSTVTSLIALSAARAGLEPTFAIGADLYEIDGNAGCGAGRFFIAEADESDGSFLYLKPLYAVVTNIDREHMDYYSDMGEVMNSYKKFMGNIRPGGCLFYCGGDYNLARAASDFGGRRVSYGLAASADVSAKDVRLEGFSSVFECEYKGRVLGEVHLALPGEHNVSNALAAVAVALEIGIDFKIIKDTLQGFRGVKRRLGVLYDEGGIMLIDDYAHHPTEIKATLGAIKGIGRSRIICVFQPHRYTRTKHLEYEFGRCFGDAHHLVVTDIYAAGEPAMEGISGMNIYKSAVEAGHGDVHFVPKEEIIPYLMDVARGGDIVAFLGAGDIGKVAKRFKSKYAGKFTLTT